MPLIFALALAFGNSVDLDAELTLRKEIELTHELLACPRLELGVSALVDTLHVTEIGFPELSYDDARLSSAVATF